MSSNLKKNFLSFEDYKIQLDNSLKEAKSDQERQKILNKNLKKILSNSSEKEIYENINSAIRSNDLEIDSKKQIIEEVYQAKENMSLAKKLYSGLNSFEKKLSGNSSINEDSLKVNFKKNSDFLKNFSKKLSSEIKSLDGKDSTNDPIIFVKPANFEKQNQAIRNEFKIQNFIRDNKDVIKNSLSKESKNLISLDNKLNKNINEIRYADTYNSYKEELNGVLKANQDISNSRKDFRENILKLANSQTKKDISNSKLELAEKKSEKGFIQNFKESKIARNIFLTKRDYIAQVSKDERGDLKQNIKSDSKKIENLTNKTIGILNLGLEGKDKKPIKELVEKLEEIQNKGITKYRSLLDKSEEKKQAKEVKKEMSEFNEKSLGKNFKNNEQKTSDFNTKATLKKTAVQTLMAPITGTAIAAEAVGTFATALKEMTIGNTKLLPERMSEKREKLNQEEKSLVHGKAESVKNPKKLVENIELKGVTRINNISKHESSKTSPSNTPNVSKNEIEHARF